MKLPLIRLSILGFFLALFFLPTVAYARDCPPDDESRQDCKNAATTARNPLVPISGSALGGAAGWAVGRTISRTSRNGKKTEDENDREKKDPCQDHLDRLGSASANAKVLQASRENLQNMLNLLETQYEYTREASYLSGAIDIGFLAGSIFTKPVAGFLGKEIVNQTLKQKLVESALKAVGKEATKVFVKMMNEQGFKWESFFEKPLDAARKKYIQETLKEAIVQDQMNKFIRQGLNPQGPVAKAVQDGIKTNLAGPLADAFGNFLSLASMAEGVISGAQKLEAIRNQMSEVGQRLFEIELQFEDAVSEMELARHALEYCRKIRSQ